MNKFIHPRNVYKKHPDFSELSRLYPEFRSVCENDENGKPTIDFQDERSLAILTRCLLLKDFQLTVDFPVNRLIPTLPLRLNYILWIEDILNTFGIRDASGIDIGCGASCIYPLLAARKNNWTMTGLEVDKESYESAQLNIANNSLADQVSVILQSPESGIFDRLLEGNSSKFDFCLCNPPFYDGTTDHQPKNRTGHRPPPRNAKTGSQVELSCDGGEVEFVKKIISGSLKFASRIRFFTTMIGVKNDLTILVKELRRVGVTNYIETEFCQGRTTRWGLAWSFDEHDSDFYLRTVPCIKSTFVKEPAIFFIPEPDPVELSNKGRLVEGHLLRLFKEIEIIPVEIPRSPHNEKRWRMKLHRVTWTNTRRKRREQSRAAEDLESESPAPTKRLRLGEAKPILVGDIYLNTVHNGHTVQIFYLDGSQGRDACQQIQQYVINQFNKIF